MPDDVTWLCYGFGCARSRPTSQREQLRVKLWLLLALGVALLMWLVLMLQLC